MKKIILFTFSLLASTSDAETLAIPFSQLVAKNWQIISFSKGDLNQDQTDDIALLLKPKNAETSGPKLVIYFHQNNEYTLKLSKPLGAWIYANEQECISSALDESSLTIQRHVLKIKFNDEPICSNTYSLNYTYTFKYDHNHFQLIGFDSFSGDKLSGNITEKSVNYLSHKIKIQYSNFFPNKKFKAKVEWKKLENKKSYNLENISFDSDDYNLQFEEQYK